MKRHLTPGMNINVFTIIAVFLFGSAARAGYITTENFYITSSAGGSGSGGSTTSDMIINTSPASSFSGGSVGLQGSASTAKGGITPTAANVAFKFNVGSVIDSLNAQYGVGNWTATNPTLTFQSTLYASNTLFGGGAGNFETYWVANDNWAQGTNDPSYATNLSSLLAWAGSASDLGTSTYAWTSNPVSPTSSSWKTSTSGPTASYALADDPQFLNDIDSASAASDPNVSLYLAADSSSLGLTIFTGGGTSLPELSFDVVSTPEPGTIGLFVLGAVPLIMRRTRRKVA